MFNLRAQIKNPGTMAGAGREDGKIVGAIGFEPTQPVAPNLQSGPALQLRRAPM